MECREVNVPEVDNTEIECQVGTKEQCVVATKKRIVPIVINVGDTYDTVMDKLLDKIRQLETRINNLEP